MNLNRYSRITLIVIAFGLGALLSAQVGAPHAGALHNESSESEKRQSGAVKLNRDVDSAPRAPQATLPPTWRVPIVHESIGVDGAFCTTAIVLVNPLATSLGGWEVEWWSDVGTSLALESDLALQPGVRYTIIADDQITPFWGVTDVTMDLDNFTGWVSVHGDPRILVSAFEWCRSAAGSGGTLVTVNNLPAFPVGATAEFFQAGMPATWTPPMAAPEPPE
jgi:hypothetical protein